VNDLLDLFLAHKWFAFSALLIGFVVRLLKSDTKLPFSLPPQYRAWLALGLGVADGVLDALANGTPWTMALLGGLGAAMTAIVGHETLVEGLRSGIELPVPGLTKPRDPSAGSKKAPPAAVAALVALFMGLGLPGAAPASLAAPTGVVALAGGTAVLAGCNLTPAQDATLVSDIGKLVPAICPLVGLAGGTAGAVCQDVAPFVSPLVGVVEAGAGAADLASCSLTPISGDGKTSSSEVCASLCGDMSKATGPDPCPRVDAAIRAGKAAQKGARR
jgi:hypothetical protein